MTAFPDNLPGLQSVSGRQLALVGASASDQLPAIFLRSESAGRRFWEFFTANIRNRNTRRAYFVAVTQFSKWCDQKKLRLEDIQPIDVAAYIEQLGAVMAKPSVKQQLAAIRMLFDWLVTGQVMPTNPAHAVRGPKHSVKKGKTSVLSAEEMGQLLTSIDTGTLIGLRDRALIALMGYTFARVGATGITTYLQNGGKLEVAQQMAAYESARTTGLYDRRNDSVALDEVERIAY